MHREAELAGHHQDLRSWLADEHQEKKGSPLDLSDWEDYDAEVAVASQSFWLLNRLTREDPREHRSKAMPMTVAWYVNRASACLSS